MKRIFYLTLAVLAFTACKKKKSSPTPAIDLYNYWSLDYTSTPFAQDASWKPAIGVRTYFVLGKDGNYTGGNGPVGAGGTFTVIDSAGFKILTLSNATPPFQKMYIQLTTGGMIADSRLGTQPADYIRWKFGQNKKGEY